MAERKSWEEQVKDLKVEEAPADLLARITTVVPNMQQETARERPGFLSALRRFAAEWQYGLALKAAAFACVAVLGVMTGVSGAEEADLFSSLVFGDIGWESVI